MLPAINRNSARPRAIAGTRARRSTAPIRLLRVIASTDYATEAQRHRGNRTSIIESFLFISPCLRVSVANSFCRMQIPHIQLQPDITHPRLPFEFVSQVDRLIRLRPDISIFHATPPDSFERSIGLASHAKL